VNVARLYRVWRFEHMTNNEIAALIAQDEAIEEEEAVKTALEEAAAEEVEQPGSQRGLRNCTGLAAGPAEEPADEVAMTPEGKVAEAPVGYAGVIMQNRDALGRRERKGKIVLEGVASRCCHCSLKLTDAVSIQRGIGPICSKKGYLEEPDQPDEIAAMAILSEYPELVDFLVANWKSKGDGVRGLMNGLVHICSLNRKTHVHDVCTEAIELLGYRNLASQLRESLAVAEIKDSKGNPNHFAIWIKKSEWTPGWRRAFRGAFPHSHFSRNDKGMLFKKEDKGRVWGLLKQFYLGYCLKVPGGKTVRILPKPQTT
jgi:hypothetical protein